MAMVALIIPSNPRVAMMGATLAIGPELVCFRSNRMKAISINALSAAPASIAMRRAIQ